MAAQFRFALQAVLDAHQRLEDEKLQELAACRRALDGAAREIEHIAHARDRCMSELAASAYKSVALHLRVRDAYLRRLDEVFAQESRAHRELLAAWKCACDALIAARRARRTLERLKDRRLRAFLAEEARREELELDESNARAYDRAQRAGRAAS
jgi:flagellar export protein FliJ